MYLCAASLEIVYSIRETRNTQQVPDGVLRLPKALSLPIGIIIIELSYIPI
jgi:hypothetical protein